LFPKFVQPGKETGRQVCKLALRLLLWQVCVLYPVFKKSKGIDGSLHHFVSGRQAYTIGIFIQSIRKPFPHRLCIIAVVVEEL
jgi:hypothetical protein